ncbi:MAG: B12-binding domain-containing radical SAM protein [Syntrophobacteraceae bacterium]
MPKILLLNPEFPRSFWSLELFVHVSGAKSLMPPLGLLTVAALLPLEWQFRLVDLNVRKPTEDDWQWADMVMVTGMAAQKEGLLKLCGEAARRGRTVVAGGPYATAAPRKVLDAGCDFLFLGEVEDTIHDFLRALDEGKSEGVFPCDQKPDLARSPLPRYDLVNPGDYLTAGVQTSRGCPFDCEFCDVVSLFGRKIRYKSPDQVVEELENLRKLGWWGEIFICDDNFVGSRAKAQAILDRLLPWSKQCGEPFSFITQVSVNLGRDPEMIDRMTEANFSKVFVGLESPDENVLRQIHKIHNIENSMVDSVNTMTRNGLSVIGSFILGLDGEPGDVASRICAFVDQTAIPTVMVGLIQAPPGTKLWKRLHEEGRLFDLEDHGDSMGWKPTFETTRPLKDITDDLAAVWEHLYSTEHLLERTYRYHLSMRPTRSAMASARGGSRPQAGGPVSRSATPSRELLTNSRILLGLIWWQGIKSRARHQFWKQLFGMWRNNPSRIKRYLSACAFGENLSRLSLELKTRSRSPN